MQALQKQDGGPIASAPPIPEVPANLLGQVTAFLCDMLHGTPHPADQSTNIMAECSRRYQENLALPTTEEILQYLELLKPRMQTMLFDDIPYTLEEIEVALQIPRVTLMRDCIVDNFTNAAHGMALANAFQRYLKKYEWPLKADSPDIIFQGFIIDDIHQASLALQDGRNGRTIDHLLAHLKERFQEEILRAFLTINTERVRKLLRDQFDELLQSLETLPRTYDDNISVEALRMSLIYKLGTMVPGRVLTENFTLLENFSMATLVSIVIQEFHTQLNTIQPERLQVFLRKIEGEASLYFLCAAYKNLCLLDKEILQGNVGIFFTSLFQKELRAALEKRIKVLLKEMLQPVFAKTAEALSVNQYSLLYRLSLQSNHWRSQLWEEIQQDAVLAALPWNSQLLTNTMYTLVDEHFQQLITGSFTQSVDAFIATRSLNLRKLNVNYAKRGAVVQKLLVRDILQQAEVQQIDPSYVQHFAQRLEDDSQQPTQAYDTFRADLLRLYTSVQKLQGFIQTPQPEIDAFALRLAHDIEHIDLLFKKAKFPLASYIEKFNKCRRLIIEALNHFINDIKPLYVEGDTDVNQITYCLRPFLCQLFNVNVVTQDKTLPLLIELDQIITGDAQIVATMEDNVFQALPKQLCSNVPFLPQLNRFDYQTEQRGNITVEFLLSVVHLLGSTELYSKISMIQWFSRAKPLKNALVTLLAALPPGTFIDSELSEEVAAKFVQVIKTVFVKDTLKELRAQTDPFHVLAVTLMTSAQFQDAQQKSAEEHRNESEQGVSLK